MAATKRELHRFELEPEVCEWLDSLSDSDYKRVDEVAGLLAEEGTGLGGPWSDHLEGQVWELRLRLARVAVSVTYWCRPDGTIVMLTVFHKTRQTTSGRSTGLSAPSRRASATTTDRWIGPSRGTHDDRLHTRWVLPAAGDDDPERIAIREALAFGKAVYERRTAMSIVADLAVRAGMTTDEVECIEEGGTEPTIALLRRLAAALDADVRLTPGHDLGSVGFEAHAA